MTNSRVFGLVSPAQARALSGLELMCGVQDGSLPAPPFAETADIEPIELENGRVVFHGRPAARFYNPMGMIHGGWLAMLLDTVMGCAVHTTLAAGQAYTTLEMSTTFVKAVFEKTGVVRAEGVLLHRGSRIASAEGKLYDANGTLLAHGTETCLIMSP